MKLMTEHQRDEAFEADVKAMKLQKPALLLLQDDSPLAGTIRTAVDGGAVSAMLWYGGLIDPSGYLMEQADAARLLTKHAGAGGLSIVAQLIKDAETYSRITIRVMPEKIEVFGVRAGQEMQIALSRLSDIRRPRPKDDAGRKRTIETSEDRKRGTEQQQAVPPAVNLDSGSRYVAKDRS